MGQEVKIPQSVLLGLLLMLVISLMSVAFLMGRQTAPAGPVASGPANPPTSSGGSGENRPGPRELQVGSAPVQPAPVVAPPAVAPAPVAPAPPVYQPPAPAPMVPPAAPAPAVRPAPAPVAVAPPPAAPAPAPAPAPPPASADPAIQGYFKQIDVAMEGTSNLGDGNQLATEILQQGMNGKTEGFDNLIDNTKKAQAAVRKIRPPAACSEHYQLLNRQLDKSLQLLVKVKDATVSLDTGTLTALAGEGKDMQAEAERFKKLDEQLRRR